MCGSYHLPHIVGCVCCVEPFPNVVLSSSLGRLHHTVCLRDQLARSQRVPFDLPLLVVSRSVFTSRCSPFYSRSRVEQTRRAVITRAQGKVGSYFMGAWLLLMLGHAYFFSFNADENFDRTARCYSPIKRNAFWNLWQSCLKYGEFRAEFERCATVQQQYNEHPQCAETEADLVFIIGESFSRHMSNLYDGAYNTNPLLVQRQRTDKGRLFVFTNAIATDNGTTQNFKYFMSTASVDQKGVAWCDRPLFPTILRRCGYNVTFYSNQFAPNDNLGQWDASMDLSITPALNLTSSTTAIRRSTTMTFHLLRTMPNIAQRLNALSATSLFSTFMVNT